jgi:gliding motility-associated protein GldM
MSGGNCPETPRQKMIGMMYLFLTALLAINVSGELLKAFVTMDEGFIQSRETVERKNGVLYSQFANAHSTNPVKVGKYWESAQAIQKEANDLVEFIQDLKVLMAKTSSGPEATPDNYTGIDNQDIAPQIMITEQGGARSEELKDKINKYKELMLSKLDSVNDPTDATYINSYNKVFDTSGQKTEKDVKKSWESIKFENVPLSASMAMLSKIQGDVRNAEADMISRLYTKIDQSSYKFTTVKPLVIPEDRSIVKGGTYRAKILMAAYDETALPEITVNGESLVVEGGYGVLELPASRTGEKSWSGTIEMLKPDGSKLVKPIKGEYIVTQPNVVISPTKMNVFYEGVQNPVEISVPGVNTADLKVSMTNVTPRKRGDEYIVTPKPGTAGKKSIIRVSANIDGKIQSIGSQEFRIKRVPDPVPVVAGKSDGKIGKNVLLAQAGVFAEMKDFDFELEYKVSRFNISVLKGGYIVDERSNSSRFTDAQKELIKTMSRGSKVSIEDIRAKGPDGSTRKLGTITFILD